MVHIIATFIISFLVSVVVEMLLLQYMYFFCEESMVGAVLAYPFVFVSVFVLLYKIYTDKDDKNVKTYTYYVDRIGLDNLINKDVEGEFSSSENYVRKTRNKVIGQSIVLSLIIPFMAMLFISIPSKYKYIFLILLLPVVKSQVQFIITFYRNLLKKARDRKIRLIGNEIQIFDEYLDGYIFDLKKLHKIEVKKNDISTEIVQVQLFDEETINKKNNITIAGYNDMDILLGKLTLRMRPLLTGKVIL